MDDDLVAELATRREEDQRVRRQAPHPIEDPERLDERRAEVGLEPFAAYEARMRDRA